MAVSLLDWELKLLREAGARLLSVSDHVSLEGWSAGVLEVLGPLFRADRVFLGVPFRGAFSVHQSDPDMQRAGEEYVAYYHRLDTFMGAKRRQLGINSFVTEMIAGGSELRRAEIWHDWSVPHRLFDPSGIALDLKGTPLQASLNVYHERPHDGGFGERGLTLLRLLEPYFVHVVATLERARRRRRETLADLDRLDVPGVVFDPRGECVLATAAWRSRFVGRTRSELAAVARRLAQRAFGTLGAVPSPLSKDRGGKRETVRAQFGGREWDLSAAWIGSGSDALMLVQVHSDAVALIEEGELRRQFGLTRREAEVAVLLAGRLSNREIARRLGTSQHTARRHTERVLACLGVRSRRAVAAAIAGSRIS